MLLLNLRSFVNRLVCMTDKGRRKESQRELRRKQRPSFRFEALEDRTLLSTFNVTSAADDNGNGTLRSAIQLANSTAGADTIVFDQNINGSTITLTQGELTITEAVTITGNGPLDTVISGGDQTRVFNATLTTGDVTISRLTVDHGKTGSNGQNREGGGAGIRFMSTGKLSLSQVTVSNNFVSGDENTGGGIYSKLGSVELTNCIVSSNGTTGRFGCGGGIFSDGGITVLSSTVSGNTNTGDTGSGVGLASLDGSITVKSSSIQGNKALGPNASGGGIWTDTGAITVSDSTIEDNQTLGSLVTSGQSSFPTTGGGGIYSGTGTVTVTNSTVAKNVSGNLNSNFPPGNRGQGGGAGIFVKESPGSINLFNSTVSGNIAQSFAFYGGGLSVRSASINLVNSTVVGNRSDGDFNRVGGGVYAQSGKVTVTNSIIAGNINSPSFDPASGVPDLNPGTGTLTITNSLIGNNKGFSNAFAGTGLTPDATNHNLIGTSTSPIDPLVETLADNGGSSKTHALKANSPAIDRGSDSLAKGVDGNVLTTDQRGTGSLRKSGLSVDMGAFELQSTQPVITAIAIPFGAANPVTTGSATFSVSFSKNVTGVSSGAFQTIVTGSVQAGAVVVSGSGRTYTVTVNGITGSGTLGLNLLDSNGAIKSQDKNETLLQTSFTGAVYNIAQARSLAVQSIGLAAGATNPTSASSASFTVTFNEGVSGVAPSQFFAVKTGTVTSGNLTVAKVSDAVYAVTVNGVSGVGTLGLNFNDDGGIKALSDQTGITQDTFTGTVFYNVIESPTLSVQSIAFPNGASSTTSATSVSFVVTFSAPVINVAASQFTASATGGVSAGTPQLTGSGAVYTVTVGGITGSGSLGLNFQDNGSVRRQSDNLAMTTTTFAGPSYTIVPGTQGSTVLDVGGLEFQVVGGGNFSVSNNLNTVTGQVQVGFVPTNGSPLTPLLMLNGSITVDTGALSFSATGSLVSLIGGTSRTLFDRGVTNVSISSLLGSGSNSSGGSSVTVAGGQFTLSSFALTQTPSPTINMQGSLVLPKGITIAVNGNNFARINSTGISLDGATFSLTNTFSIKGATFSTDNLTASYTTAGSVFTLTGKAGVTVRDIAALSVNFTGTGLVISNGVFSSLDATVDGFFTVKGVKITADSLHFRYVESTQLFSMSGTASVTVGGLDDNLSVTFGQGNSPGIEISNGSLDSLDMTVNAQFHVAKVTISATNLRFTYATATRTFTLTGTAGIAIAGVDDTLSVTFGHNGAPGLVITNGSLVSLDVTVNAQFHVARVTITATDLRFTYTAASKTFTMTGTAGFTISGVDDRLSVTFGYEGNPGLVVVDGKLISLDVSINTVFHVSKVTITATDLRLTYTANSNPALAGTYTLTGTAGFSIKGVDGANGEKDQGLSVTFGHGNDPGLIVENGALKKLDVTVNAKFIIKKVTITATDLRFTYTPNSNPALAGTYTLTGTAMVQIKGAVGQEDSKLSVTFGQGGRPGLVIAEGTLQSLDVTVNADFKVSKVTITVRDLRFTYTANTSTFTLEGTAAITIDRFGANLSITFGHRDGVTGVMAPGLVVVDGTLERLDMTVNAGFRVASVLDVNVRDLRFTFTRASNEFTLSGAVLVSPVGLSELANIEATFGDANQPGLVVRDGSLVSLHVAIRANVTYSALTVRGELSLDYQNATRTIVISGSGSIAVAGIGSLNVRLGGGTTQGLVIVNGQVTTYNMMIDTNISLAGLTLNGVLVMNYNSNTRLFVMTGNVTLNIGSIGNVTATLGGPGTSGLVVQNGSLISLDMRASADFRVGPLSLSGSLTIMYSSSPSRFLMYGTATGAFFGADLFTIVMGNASRPGMDIRNGSLSSLSVVASGNFTVLGIPIGSASLTANYDAGRGEFYFAGEAGIDLPDFIPDWLASAMGGRRLASLTVVIDVISGNNRDSYVQAEIGVLGQTFGFKKPFDGRLSFIGTSPLATIADAVVTVGYAIADAAVVVGNAIADAATDVWNWFSSWWGPLEGATVFYDPDFKFDFVNDPKSVTGADGRFLAVVPVGAKKGQLIVVGGLDRSTGLTNELRLTAPYDARVVSPLTSLVNQLMQQRNISPDDAVTVVDRALGLPLTMNLLTQSLALDATGGDLQSAKAFSREVQVGILVHQVSSLLSGLPGAPSVAELSTTAFSALAKVVTDNGGATLDLSDPNVVRKVIDRAAKDAGLTLKADDQAGAVTIITEVNKGIEALPLTNANTFLNQLLQYQTVTQGKIAPQLARVTAGQVSIATVVSQNTGSALTAQVQQAKFGQLNAIGPTVSITPLVSQDVGVGQPSTFDFQLYLSSPTPLTVPVSVDFVAAGQTATTARGDFDQKFGTVTWQPGDTAPKTISIPVHAVKSDVANRLFTVELSKPVNAELVNRLGLGNIAQSDFATVTSLVTSSPSSQFGQSVTFTATVTNQDPAKTTPNTGTVTFFDGDQFLGTVNVVNGEARFSTSTLTAAVHEIKATYSGFRRESEDYLPSTSAGLRQVVGQISQTINFPSQPPLFFDSPPLVLVGSATSGLPLEFKILSGPASVVGNVLTVLGGGSVVIEASQAGDANFSSATAVTRTLLIDDPRTGPKNSAPVAKNGSTNVQPGSSVTTKFTATDAENDPLTFGISSQPAHGTVVVNDDGTFTYTSTETVTGTDSFTFFANDSELIGNTATINVTISNLKGSAPVATDSTLSVDSSKSAGGKLDVFDADQDPLTFTLKTKPTHGVVALQPDGRFVYSLTDTFVGTDTFTYTASDGQFTSNTATVSVTISNLKGSAPVAKDSKVSVSLAKVAIGTLDAVDADQDPLTFTVKTKPAHGTVVVNPNDGGFVYVSTDTLADTDTFTFTASDGQFTSNEAVVSVIVKETSTLPFDLTLAQNVTINTKKGVRLDPSAVLANVQPGTDLTTASILVTSNNAGTAKDTLAIFKGGTVGLRGKKILVSGQVVGTFSNGTSGKPLVIKLTAGTEAAINTILQAITAKAGKPKKPNPQTERAIEIKVIPPGQSADIVTGKTIKATVK